MTWMGRRGAAGLLVAALACGGGGRTPDGGGAPASCLPGCPGSRAYDAQAYALHARFDGSRRVLVASEDVTLVLGGGGGAVVELDATVDVKAVRGPGGPLAFAADPAKERVRVDLGPLRPGSAPVTFTVDYEAPTSDSLLAPARIDDDPVGSRVVFTDSEPRRGHQWLVEKDDPADRALFSVDLTVAADEDVVSNGLRQKDEQVAGGRRVQYALDVPIPTYLMAFAAGQLEHADGTAGTVPISVWYRRGLSLDPQRTLAHIASAMQQFEALVGPFPWPRYSEVLLPTGGGMENATITFNDERAGQGAGDAYLTQHELAHHWFGDWVTMRTYDDVWFKEGMATLLESEAFRPERDLEGRGRLFGSDFGFNAADAIVDRSLTGLAKYTTGPYGRSAALITQVRARLGETVFWARARAFLAAHARDSASGEDFLRAFAPELPDADIGRVLAALESKDRPAFQATPTFAGWAVRLDAAGVPLLEPYRVTRVEADGGVSSVPLVPGQTTVVPSSPDGYTAPDEQGAFPEGFVAFELPDETSYFDWAITYAPDDWRSVAGAAWLSRSAEHQERALLQYQPPGQLAAADLATFVPALDSSVAREDGLSGLCDAPFTPAGWLAALETQLLASPAVDFDARRARCSVPSAVSELAAVGSTPPPAVQARAEYLLSFDFGQQTFGLVAPIARTAPSRRLRETAVRRLALQFPSYGYTAIADAQRADYAAFFREQIALATSSRRFLDAWGGSVRLPDLGALPLGGAALQRVPLSAASQRRVVCNAAQLALSAQPATWKAFQDAAQPWTRLSAAAQAVLGAPQGCSQPSVVARRAEGPVRGRGSVERKAERALPE